MMNEELPTMAQAEEDAREARRMDKGGKFRRDYPDVAAMVSPWDDPDNMALHLSSPF